MSHIGNSYQVIYKSHGVKRTMIVSAKDPSCAGKRIKGGRVISIRKINTDDAFGFSDSKFRDLMIPSRDMLVGDNERKGGE